MPSMMDHVADTNGVELFRLAKQYEFPEFVKQANPDQTLRPGTMPIYMYAYPIPGRQQFPCHTAASTWLSALYFNEKRAEFHPKEQVQIDRRLDHYARFWRIKPAVDAVAARWQELHKTAEEQLPDHMFAYVWVDDDGRKDRHLRLTNAMEVKAAAEYVRQHRDRIPYAIRHTMAGKILEKAAKYGAAIGDDREFLEKQAGQGVCDPAEVVQMINDRSRLVKNHDLRQQFVKLADTVAAAPRRALLPDMMVKLAGTVDQLDRQLGLVGKYADGLPRPEDVIFKGTFGKIASDLAEHVGTTSGKLYEKSAFRKLALADVTSLFGNDFAERVKTPLGDVDPEKMAEEAATLPRPDAELLDQLLGDQGIRPVLHKAASARQGFTREEMNAWANAYRSVG